MGAAMFISKVVEPDREEREKEAQRAKSQVPWAPYVGWERKRKWRFFWVCLIVGLIVTYLIELEIM